MTRCHMKNSCILCHRFETAVTSNLRITSLRSHDQQLTGAIFGVDGVSVVTGSAGVAVRSGRVVHAAQTLARQRVAVGEQHVGICVAMAMARLAHAAEHHGVAVVTGAAPVAEDSKFVAQPVFFRVPVGVQY